MVSWELGQEGICLLRFYFIKDGELLKILRVFKKDYLGSKVEDNQEGDKVG